MTLEVGQKMPTGTLRQLDDGIQKIDTDSIFDGKKVVFFAVPGVFTPTCNDTHFPGFQGKKDALREKGIDSIVCMAVNDPFVMAEWKKALGEDEIELYSDGNGDYARELGLTLDLTAAGMGIRSKRFAAVVDDGQVTYLGVEAGKDVDASSAEAVLEFLS